jgi:hypothetical protein
MSRLPWMKQEADPSEVILIEWWDLNKFSQVLCSRQVNYALQRTTLSLGYGSFASQNAAVDSWSVPDSIACGRSSRDSPSLGSSREIRGDI